MPPTSSAAADHPAAAGPRAADAPGDSAAAAFGRPFWLTYSANCSMMVAISLLFRYGDFIKCAGGNEVDLGWIVCAGMVGSLAMRLAQGVGIDTYGPRQIWLWSSGLFIASCLGHLAVTTAHGPLVYGLRVLFQTSIAGFFGASITYISGRAPIPRMAEVIGTLGTSGFVGMMLGTSLGDYLLQTIDHSHVHRMFAAAAMLGTVGFVLSCLATRGQPVPPRRRRVPTLLLLKRYHPGCVLLMAVAMGFGLGLPGVFLTRYAASLEIPRLALFFWVYAPLAFITRLTIRRLPERHGIRPMILWGMGSLVASMLLFLVVRTQWHFVFPAVFLGIAHAFLFPAVVAGGSGAFPTRYRGLGTTLMLAMFDLGYLIGMPAVGETLHRAEGFGLPPYPTMFVAVASVLALCSAAYLLASRATGSEDAELDSFAVETVGPPEALAAVDLGGEG